MRVLQLIDSLRSGGAERMAVSYANALVNRIDCPYLCCTRQEGVLRNSLYEDVGYLFLNKRNTLDVQALLKLRQYVKKYRINIIQAHSSSWFFALLVKLSLPQVLLVWHDHYGKGVENRKSGVIKSGSKLFDGIISVNKELQQWAQENLKCRQVRYFPNFLPDIEDRKPGNEFVLPVGFGGSFKLLCLANLRPQKDHLNLLEAFNIFSAGKEDVSLHLVGKDTEDKYSEEIKKYIRDNKLKDKVFLYGEQREIHFFLAHADAGVLSSSSEGLPVALLEYGRAGLPVICTRVGECEKVVGANGILVNPNNPKELAGAFEKYYTNKKLRKEYAADFQEGVKKTYMESAILPDVLDFLAALKAE